MRFEPLEERQLLAVGPQLIGVNPNNSDVLKDGEIRHLSPQELTFRFDQNQVIDAATLSGIRISRSGQDGVFGNGNDVLIAPGFVGIGERPNEVVTRFADALPDDWYRITVFGAGPTPLRNINGQPFNGGVNQSLDFELDLGAQIISVVPQPLTRDSVTGVLTQAADQIVVYFNNDNLDPAAVTNPAFFRLIDTADGSILFPSTVNYDQDQDTAVLVFGADLPSGTFHLQIGASEELNDTLSTATHLGTISQNARFATFTSPIHEDPDGNPIPTPIPDQGTVISTITVEDWFVVSDLEVELNIDHTWGPDLRVFLTSPEGTRVELIRDLGSEVLDGQIYGSKFDDLNGDGVRDPDEPGLEGWTMYLDANRNSVLDPGEMSTVTDANGDYAFVGLDVNATYTVAEVPQPRWRQTAPAAGGWEEQFRADFSAGSLQTIRFSGNPTSGTFRLGFDGRTTAPITFAGPGAQATTAANIQAELSLITDPWIAVAVTVGGAANEYQVAFTLNGISSPVDHPILRVDENLLNTGVIAVETTAQDDGFTSAGPSDQWHLSVGQGMTKGHSGLDSFYFGSGETLVGGGSYKNNADGTLTSPVIDLSDPSITGPVRLEFNHLLGIETGWDYASVIILPEEGQATTVFTTDQPTNGFQPVSLDISQFAGQRIQVEFRFVSDGSVTFEGWYVDDIRVSVGRGVRSVALSDSPQGQIVKNVDFGDTRGPVVGPDAFGYEAFTVTTAFEDIAATGTSTLQSTLGAGFAVGAGQSGSDQAKSIARDAAGNVYITGAFQGTVDFDPDPAVSWELTSAGSGDVFVAKYAKDGTLVWAGQIGGPEADVGNSIAVDGAGDVYITGSFSGTADFDPGADVSNLVSAGGSDIFVAKLDTAGDLVWARRMGGPGADAGNAVAVGPNGNVLSTGYFSGTVDFDFGIGVTNLISFGNTDIFVSKLDSSGDFVWARQMGGELADQGNDIAVDAAGSVLITGSFSGTADFDPSLLGILELVSAGSTDIFVSKLGSAGDFVWARQFGGTGSDRGNAVALDPDNNVYVTGVNSDDVFLVKLDPAGGTLWTRQFGGPAADSGEDVAIDLAGNVNLTGSFRRTVDFGDGVPLDSAGGADVFVVRMGEDGTFDFVRTMGGALDDFAYGLVLDADSNVFTTGSFRGTADFDTGATTTVSLTSLGGTDIFLAALAVPVGVDDGFVYLSSADLAGFEFEFYGVPYNELFFSSNGLISFETSNDSPDNTDLTDPPAEAVVAPFWEDMTTGSRRPEAVFWEVRGTGDAQRLIIQWNNVRLTGAAGLITGPLDFQVVLREADNSIQYNYRSVTDSLAIPLGAETPVGSFLKGSQRNSDVAMDPSGNYVVVWESPDQDGDLLGVFARQFFADGTPMGDEFQVNTTTLGDQMNPRVAVNAGGSFVVVWEGNGPDDADGILARLFDSAGVPQGDEIQVNPFTTGVQTNPDVKIDDAGNFVVAWNGEGEDNDTDGVFARQFDATGQPLGLVDEVQMITFLGPPAPSSTFTLLHRGVQTGAITYAGQNRPNVTAANIQAALRALPNTGNTLTVTPVPGVDEVQTITFTGNPTTGDFELDYAGQVTQPIAYAGPGNEGQTAANIQAELTALGLTVTVVSVDNAYVYSVTFTGPSGSTDHPLLALGNNNLDQGALTVAETIKGEEAGVKFEVAFLGLDGGQDQPLLVHGDRLNGVTHLEIVEEVPGASGEFRVNSFTPGPQSRPAVTMDTNANFVVSWDSDAEDGDLLGVFAKRFDAAGVAQPGDTDEVQQITLEGPPAPGSTFTLRLGTAVTQTITYVGPNSGSQTAQNIQTALRNLSPVFSTVTVDPEPGASDEVQLLTFSAPPNQPTAGTFRLAHRGLITAPITFAGVGQQNGVQTAQNIQDALNALANVGGGITVAPVPGAGTEDRVFVVTFAGADGGVDHPLMVFLDNQLNQGSAVITGVDGGGLAGDQFVVTFSGAAGRQDQPPLELEDNTGGVSAITTVEVVPGSNSEFQVNFEITKDQGSPAMASRPDGRFAVAWQSDGQDGDRQGIFAQLYESTGTAVGSEFQVNTYTEADQISPKVAVDADGNFVIIWQSAEQDGESGGIYARRFTVDGTPLGDEFLVNTVTAGNQEEPAIAMAPGGEFVATWTTPGGGGGIHAQRFDASGTPIGTETQVSVFGVRDQDHPAVARDAAGNYVVVWKDLGRDPDISPGIYAQLFDADGRPLGPVDEVQRITFLGPPDPSSTFTLIYRGVETGSITYEGPGLGADTAANIETALRALPNTGETLTVTPVPDTDEVQTITFKGGPTSGDFTLEFTGQTTQPIVYAGAGGGAATAANIQAALQALGVSVAVVPAGGTSDEQFVVTFTGADAGIDQPFLTLADNNLDQGSLTVVETVKGADTDDTVFEVVFSGQDGAQDQPLLIHGDKLNGVPDLEVVEQVRGVKGEFRVNEITDGEQDALAVAMDYAGNFVISWDTFIEDPDPEDGVDGPRWDVHARVFNAAGEPLTGEFQVNTTVEGDQGWPDVAINPDDGSFVIAWEGPDEDGSGVFGQRYDAAGTPIGGEFQVNTETEGNQWDAAVAMDPAGDSIVVWSSYGPDAGIYGQRYDAAGVPQGDEFQVNTTTGDGEDYPDVAMDAAGSFVVVWETYVGLSTDVLGQRFDAAGQPLGSEFQINDVTYSTMDFVFANLSMAPNGDFVVAWSDNAVGNGLIAQRFNAAGVPVGSNFQVNTSTGGDQSVPSVALGTGGEILIAWLDTGQGGQGVFTQRFQTENPSVGIKAAGPQAVGEDLLQVWVDGAQTMLVGPDRSTKIAKAVVVPDRVFAVDSLSDQIHELDPLSGAVLNSFPTPAPIAGADVDLAFAGGSLYYLSGAGGMLYELHPDNGAVVDADALADLGLSGNVNGLAYLNGQLVVQDPTAGELFFIDPFHDTLVRSVTGSPSQNVWLVGSGARGTLFTVDSGGMIVELDPDTGDELNRFAAPFAKVVGLALAEGGLFVGDGAGNVALLDPDTGAVIESLTTAVPIAAFGADAGGGMARRLAGNYQPLSGTVLDDEAEIPITAGVGPFTGRFRPVESLSAFDQENVRGNWMLEIADTAPLDTGVLQGWTLIVNDPEDTPPDFTTVAFIGDNLAAGGAQLADDVDLYRLNVLGPGTLTVEVTPQAGLDPLVRLFDSNGIELAMADDAAAGQPEVLSLTVWAAGTFFVGLSSSGNGSYSPLDGTGASGGASTGSYHLGISFSLPVESGDDNSSFSTASDFGVLGLGEQSVYAEVRTEPFGLEMPGGLDEPGHREIPPESHYGASGGASPGGVPSVGGGAQPGFAPDRLLVRFSDEVRPKDRMRILQEEGLEVLQTFESTDALLVKLPPGADVLGKASELGQKAGFLYAEPDYLYTATQLLPNDPRFGELWALDNTGQTGGTADADIDAPEAWDTFVGSANVVVAVIDTGVDYTHPDLAANMWQNPGEIAGDGIDNDGNGYIDDVYGIDTAYGDSDPFDVFGHGTHVAGTIAAVGNDGIGVVGVNWNAQIMAVKALDDFGFISTSSAIAALDYVTEMKTAYGVNVVASNNSWGGPGYSQALKDAIQASTDAGILFCASAGNEGADIDALPSYPAGYDLDGIISVAATDYNDALASFSNYGAVSVDLGAPGVDILSTMPGNAYALESGTSMAAPLVTGVAALLAGFDPAASTAQIKQAILLGADPVPSLAGITVTGGRLNAAHSLALIGGGMTAGRSITTSYYNFQDYYGVLPSGDTPGNAITENQKQRAREIFEIYGHYLGVQFVETADQGLTVVTGDLRAIAPQIPTGPGGVAGLAGAGRVIMDAAEDWGDSEYGGAWFQTAMHEIGHTLGLGHTYDLPNLTIMGGFGTGEPVFPGDADLVHGSYLHPQANTDIDLYRFEVIEPGWFTAETVAERLPHSSSLLDTQLTLYRVTLDDGLPVGEIIARNDDYYSNDSFIGLYLEAGTYAVAVTSTGNTDFDPTISDTGFGGTTEGEYELRLNFASGPGSALVDATGTVFDGDADGVPGGVFDFWFQSGNTIFVDKANDKTAGPEGDGTLGNPFDTIASALALARSSIVAPGGGGAAIADGESFRIQDGLNRWVVFEFDSDLNVTAGNVAVGFTSADTPPQVAAAIAAAINGVTVPFGVTAVAQDDRVTMAGAQAVDVANSRALLFASNLVRIVGNGGADGDPATLADNRPYLIGFDNSGNSLPDGAKLPVPQGVTVMIDAGALFKMQKANLDVGSSAQGISRSHGALQVLGTPVNPVLFRSLRNDAVGGDSDGPSGGPTPGDWGGLVFRNDSDLEEAGIFLNWVNHADMNNGGGKVFVDSVEQTFTPVHLVGARPTVSFNTITRSADAAISADPNSFDDSLGRIGPDIHGNLILNNSVNGLFIRIRTEFGQPVDRLDVPARWDDTDIVHVVTENLLIAGTPGGPQLDETTGRRVARLDGRLAIDPGVIVKLEGSRIEVGIAGQLIAEGVPGTQVVFTALNDDSYGGSGTFDTNTDGAQTSPSPGRWGGIIFNATSSGSFDHVLLAYAGGLTPIEGGFDRFNAIEIHQADVRIANSLLRDNAAGQASTDRSGRGSNGAATIFVRGAQPIIVNNVLRDNAGTAISINANALQFRRVPDPGRATGAVDAFALYDDNRGPLVRLNRLQNNGTNGMEIRGAVLTTETIWDDTDIVHVLREEITVLNHHTFSGLRLQSGTTESLVVKLDGPDAGLTADGTELDIDDRIGGTIQVIGTPGHPVVLTSLADDTVSAGFDLDGQPQGDTDNNGPSSGQPGQWRSIRLGPLSNDRNVAVLQEQEAPYIGEADTNRVADNAEYLGTLAPDEKSGDNDRRLGFEVHGFIALDNPSDVDVYSFNALAGTEIWIDIDRTSAALDTIVELVDANGTLLARSLDNNPESLSGLAVPLIKDVYLGGDFYTTNARDAAMRVVLPGNSGTAATYYVRVRSTPAEGKVEDLSGGLSRGEYQLQIRLRQLDEQPGSTIRNAEIRFSTNGIEVLGMPAHSPLTGESAESTANNDTLANAQPLGNLLVSDRNTISLAGNLSASGDIDWYQFTVDYDLIQAIGGWNAGDKTWATIFDIDYADGISRPDTVVSVFDADGNLILVSRDSNIADDLPAPGQGADIDDLTRGSFGTLDPYIGTVQLPAGVVPAGSSRTYYVAISSNAQLPLAMNATFTANANNSLIRLEPVDSVVRIAEDHIGFSGYTSGYPTMGYTLVQPETELFDISLPAVPTDPIPLDTYVVPFTLGDVVLFVSTGGRLYTVDPFNGGIVTDVGQLSGGNRSTEDIAMRTDGRLFGAEALPNAANTAGRLVEIDTGAAGQTVIGNDTIPDFNPQTNPPDLNQLTSDYIDALAYYRTGFDEGANAAVYSLYYSVRGARGPVNINPASSTLYRANPNNGDAVENNSPYGVRGEIYANIPGDMGITTGMAFVGGMLYGVSNLGYFYQIDTGSGQAFNPVLVGSGISFAGLAPGPQDVEDAAYAGLVFAITDTGDLYALNTSGVPQPVFAGGATFASTMLSATGLAFSPLDFNLWHPTMQRGSDAGHGINPAFDQSRPIPQDFLLGINGRETNEGEGGASFYFGLETWVRNPVDRYFTYPEPVTGLTPNAQWGVFSTDTQRDLSSNPAIGDNYNLPGGALGSLVTNSFSLADYAAADKPTLYFNYFLETQDANSNTDQMRDSARVFISPDGGITWEPLATNNSILSTATQLAELPRFISPGSTVSPHPLQRVQEMFDNTGGWRQARVDLSDFAGQPDLMFRFDFSTAGSMNDLLLPGDSFGDFFNKERGQNNNFEGFYIDDIIVGFAERGEMVTASADETSFFQIPQNPDPSDPSQVLVGRYQLEVRRGTEYGVLLADDRPWIEIVQTFDTNDRLVPELRRLGDDNLQREQGQILIEANTIRDASEFAIMVEAGPREASGSLTHPGAVLNVPTVNTARLVPGVTVENNVIFDVGEGGIRFSGDPNAASPLAPVPFGRILNNTIYGTGAGDVGIEIGENASPTLLNNILANLETGIAIDPSSGTTVVGANLFQNNVNNGTTGSNAILLTPTDPLFVNPANGSFYLASGSRAIDSSLNTLADRPNIAAVKSPLGIPLSAILAPERDRFYQLRIDDPSQDPPPGLGANIFKDRGAVERADFAGPTAALIVPMDNDASDYDPSLNNVMVVGERVTEFVIQLTDSGGIGIDDSTVDGTKVFVERDGALLVQGQDYTFRYDQTNDQIRLTPSLGVWALGSYRIVLDNSAATGIKDIANNLLQSNQPVGTVEFNIQLGAGVDFGDAPDPPYPTLRPAGASHQIVEGFFLGFGVDADSNGEPSAGANSDAFDDGVSFDTELFLGRQAQVTVRASAPGRLDAWIDYNRNGVWEDSEQIFASEPLVTGLNTRTFTVPSGASAAGGESFARFRFSTAGGLGPGGAASDGEVEDYRVELVTPKWRNPVNPVDVNGDGVLSAQDALFLANFLYFNGQRPVPSGPGTPPFPVAPPPYYDVNGDSFVSVQDGLLVVTALRNPGPEGEGAPLAAETTSASLVSADTLAPSATVSRILSVQDPAAVGDAVAASSTANGTPATQPTAVSSDRAALCAFCFEEIAGASTGTAGIPHTRQRPAAAVLDGAEDTLAAYAPAERTFSSSDRVAAAADRIMARSFLADNKELLDGESSALDDFFAQLEDAEQFELFGEAAAIASGSNRN